MKFGFLFFTGGTSELTGFAVTALDLVSLVHMCFSLHPTVPLFSLSVFMKTLTSLSVF